MAKSNLSEVWLDPRLVSDFPKQVFSWLYGVSYRILQGLRALSVAGCERTYKLHQLAASLSDEKRFASASRKPARMYSPL